MTEEIPKAWRSDHFEQYSFPARGLQKPVFPKASTSISGAGKSVRSIAWSCDGRRVAAGTELKGLRVWNVQSTIDTNSSFALPDSSSRPSPHNGHVGALAFSPVDPNLLVSGCKSAAAGGCIVIWDLTKPRDMVKKFQIAGDVLHIAFHPSGRQFAVVCPRSRRDEVYFYHLVDEGGKDVWEQREDVMLGGPGSEVGYDEINSLRFHPNGRFVMYVSNAGTINAWEYPEVPLPESPEINERATLDEDAQEGETSRPRTPRDRTPEHEENENGDVDIEATGQDGSEHGEKVKGEEGVNGQDAEAADGQVNGLNEGQEPIHGKGTATEELTAESTAASPTKQAVPDQDVLMEENKASTAVNSVAPTRQPSPVAAPVTGSDKAATVDAAAVDAPKKRAKQLIRNKSQYCGNSILLGFNLDPQGRFVATGGGDCRAVTYHMEDWLPFRAYAVATGTIRHVAFSPDGELLALGGDSNSDIYIVSVFSGEVVGQYKVNAMVVSLTWHPKKNWLAWATLSKANIPVWYFVKQEYKDLS